MTWVLFRKKKKARQIIEELENKLRICFHELKSKNMFRKSQGMEVYKVSGCGVSCSIVLFKKPTNKQQTINKQKTSAECYCGIRYAYIQLLAFLALEHA